MWPMSMWSCRIRTAIRYKMEAAGADRGLIRAVIGPTISQDAYEVGDDFYERFTKEEPKNKAYFAEGSRPGHWQFNLPRYILHRLKKAGVAEPENINQCTYFNENRFFSYRRSVHRKETDYGRNLSYIMISQET